MFYKYIILHIRSFNAVGVAFIMENYLLFAYETIKLKFAIGLPPVFDTLSKIVFPKLLSARSLLDGSNFLVGMSNDIWELCWCGNAAKLRCLQNPNSLSARKVFNLLLN